MGIIEDYWEDIIVYSVEFLAMSGRKTKKKFRKILVFSNSISREELFNLIPLYFRNIEKIIYIDEIEEGMFFKEYYKATINKK